MGLDGPEGIPMTADESTSRTDRHLELQEEMMLRGFMASLEAHGPQRGYAEAYDAFLDEHDLGGFIRNKPENVQDAFYKAIQGER